MISNSAYAYIVDGESILAIDDFGLSPILLNLSDCEFGVECVINGQPLPKLTDILYQVEGMARLTPIVDDPMLLSDLALSVNDIAKTKDKRADAMIFAINKSLALQLDLISPESLSDNPQWQFISFRRLVANTSYATLSLLSQAIQRLRWQANHQFCCKCGAKTVAHDVFSAVVCSQCHHRQYTQIQPCVITAITKRNPNTGKQQILLANHHRHNSTKDKTPSENPMYGLIAGFVEVGESLEQAVKREVLEEVGLQVDNLTYFGSQPWPYPSNLMVGFTAEYAGGEILLQQDELADAHFFDIDNLPHIPPTGSIARSIIEHIVN